MRQALEPLEARALAEARAQKEQFHKARSAYQESFAAGLPAAAPLPPQLKFRRPVASTSTATRGDCNEIVGGTDPDAGTWEAAADLAANGDAGVLLCPYIFSDSGDCDHSTGAETLQDLSYAMAPPATSFYVSSVRVDLIGNGVGSGVLGDFKWPNKANPYFEHSFVQLDVSGPGPAGQRRVAVLAAGVGPAVLGQGRLRPADPLGAVGRALPGELRGAEAGGRRGRPGVPRPGGLLGAGDREQRTG